MAEDIETVETATPRDARKRPPGFSQLSPVQAGLLYGGAAASVAGPLGILVGLGTGIAQHIKQKSYLDRQARYIENLDSEFTSASGNINDEMQIADPDEKRMLAIGQRMIRDGYDRMRSGDDSGQALWDKGNAIVEGVVQGDITQRKTQESENRAIQRNLVTNAAGSLRTEYQSNLSAYDQTTEAANKLLSLTAQKDFDPNKPFYKAALTSLLQDSITSFYRDTPSEAGAIFDGVSGTLGSAPNALAQGGAAAVAAIGQWLNAKDLVVSREDYNRIAMNSLKIAREMTGARMQRLSEQGQVLEAFGKRNGVFTPDYALSDYISGGTTELPTLPIPQYRPTYEDTPAPSTPARTGTWTRFLQDVKGAFGANKQQSRPTN